jgi:hypothetical protein
MPTTKSAFIVLLYIFCHSTALRLAGGKTGAETFYIILTLEKPFEVLLTKYTDGSRKKRYFGLFNDGKNIAGDYDAKRRRVVMEHYPIER